MEVWGDDDIHLIGKNRLIHVERDKTFWEFQLFDHVIGDWELGLAIHRSQYVFVQFEVRV